MTDTERRALHVLAHHGRCYCTNQTDLEHGYVHHGTARRLASQGWVIYANDIGTYVTITAAGRAALTLADR